MEVYCGPLKFTGNFDSGNLGNVELVKCSEDGVSDSASSFGNFGHYEVNLWTRQDCAGTKYSNGNRTWFYFGVSGGKPNAVLKLNILNLNKQAKLFEQGMQPVVCQLPDKPKWERIKDRVVVLDDGVKDHGCGIRQKLPSDATTSTLFIAFTYPFSCRNMTSWLDDVDSIYCDPSPRADSLFMSPSEIYYKRETICLSLEGRPVDLLTVTSIDGMSTSREPYLDNLFPYRDQERCHKFANKKVVFLSSRVHPGEVPAQFVMNGVIKFLLDERDPRARMLRRLFVFKLIPILNPDGVFRGHYRTDPRGVNLNRVYLKPSPTLHPTIYAARKLLLYAHIGHDSPDDYEIENETPSADQGDVISSSPMQLQSEGRSRLCAGCIDVSEISVMTEHSHMEPSVLTIDSENVPVDCEDYKPARTLRVPEGHQCTFESCDEDSIVDYHELRKSSMVGNGNIVPTLSSLPASSSASATSLVPPGLQLQLPVMSPLTSRHSHHAVTTKSRSRVKDLLPQIKVSMDSCQPTCSKRSQPSFVLKSSSEVESGLYAYIDFHGHATKRGIFMYGNHFDDISVQTECMLLPRLMALNCPHFDFSSCNFTEKLMTMRDRRDGASREGSGRVAVLKLTGLIRSYTLECNYNTGRLVNHLITRPDSYGFSDPPPHSIHPPKFTPEIYEEVGKSLAESILDLTDVNPWSRLKSTEHRSLDGLRGFLRRRLEHTIEYQGQVVSYRPSSIVIPGGTKSGTQVATKVSPTNSRAKTYSTPSSPSLIKKRPSTRKVSSANPLPSCSSGPLIPKRDNQAPSSPLPVTVKPGGTKLSKTLLTEKPGASTSTNCNSLPKRKFKAKLSKSKSLPAIMVESEVLPSSSSSDTRPSTKLLKGVTKKKKKTIKRKSKKLQTFKRPESR